MSAHLQIPSPAADVAAGALPLGEQRPQVVVPPPPAHLRPGVVTVVDMVKGTPCAKCRTWRPLDQYTRSSLECRACKGSAAEVEEEEEEEPPPAKRRRRPHTKKGGEVGKQCSMCKVWRPLSKYSRRSAAWDGLRLECKECVSMCRREAREIWKAMRTSE